jgi:TPR repeat protein
MKLIRDAASLGSVDAQILLGRKYESGQGVEKDLARSRHYFRLCAATAVPECQYRLARLLLSDQTVANPVFYKPWHGCSLPPIMASQGRRRWLTLKLER